jgi:hypothetical protein
MSLFIEAVCCFVAGPQYAGPPDRVARHFRRDDTTYR